MVRYAAPGWANPAPQVRRQVVEEPQLGVVDGQRRLGVEGAVDAVRDAVSPAFFAS